MNDSISDMIIRLKNAGEARKESLTFPYSKLRMEICSLLEKENFIKSVARRGKKSKMIEVTLFYNGKFPRVRGVKRISKSSRRIYKKVSDLHPVKNGYGVLVVSTPKGILTDKEARKQKVGGEAMFEIW